LDERLMVGDGEIPVAVAILIYFLLDEDNTE
jgi:hypothetical protein